jgi:hypothetical protein
VSFPLRSILRVAQKGSGRHPACLIPRSFCGLGLIVCLLGQNAAAAPPPKTDLQLAILRYPGHYNPRPAGLPQLAWALRRRTSLAIALEVAEVDPASPALFAQPMLFWQGDADFADLSEPSIANLQTYLQAGGSLWIDAADGRRDGPFMQRVRQQLRRIFAGLPRQDGKPIQLIPIASDHVIFHSFYLLGNRQAAASDRPVLEGAFVDRRLAVVLSGDDLAGSMARDAFGAWQVSVGPTRLSRETCVRLGVNWLFYVLCLDYKDDQVHLPFILQRRH